MPELLSFTNWLDECRRLRLPIETPPPANYQTFDEWYRNNHGVDITGRRALKSHGEWITERAKLGLLSNTPAPEGYESRDAWFKRTRGIDPATGKPVTVNSLFGSTHNVSGAAVAAVPSIPESKTEPSSFIRRALTGAGAVASRLGRIGSMVRGAVPVLGAASTIIHAIREGQDSERATKGPQDLHASASVLSRGGPSLG